MKRRPSDLGPADSVPADFEPADFEPDGTWYSMIAVRDDLYAVEPNHGELVKITTNGKVSRVVDVSASQGHVVPTAMAVNGSMRKRMRSSRSGSERSRTSVCGASSSAIRS